jgi:hypothetical protein
LSSPVGIRDEVLGAALRELTVPEHRPDFHARLHYLLAEERRLRIADAHRRTRTRRRRAAWMMRFAAAAAIVTAAAVVGLPRTDRGSPQPATAAEVKARVAAAFATSANLSGVAVFDGREKGDVTRWRFVTSAHGDFRASRPAGEEIAYDAETGSERMVFPEEGKKAPSAVEATGLAPGLPDPGPSDWILARDYGSVVRALLAAKDPRVKDVVYEGRAAWQLDTDVAPNLIDAPFGVSQDHFAITVDQQTGFPVKVVATFEGRFMSELSIEDLATDRQLPPGTFDLEFPAEANVTHRDGGFRRVSLSGAENVVGYEPLVPSSVPDGYELAEVAVARRAQETGVEGANPESRDVVSISYRRGLDQFLVTTRRRHVPGFNVEWSDPLGTGEGFRDEPEKIALEGGELSGLTADLLIVPRNIPHLWALTDTLVVTVSGDLSRSELVSVAESLREGS